MTYDSVYRAVVTRTDDPEAKQRLRLRVPALLGDGETGWALPLQRVSVTPAQGDSVWVFFENGDLAYPVWAPGWLKDLSPHDHDADYVNEADHTKAQHITLGLADAGHHHDSVYVNETEHTKAQHLSLGLADASHHHDAAYVNEADHTKAAHTALGLAADDHTHPGDTAWTDVTFENGWTNYDAAGSGWESCQYRKDANGFVHLKGLIKSGTLAAIAFTLPAGYRPIEGIHTLTLSNGAPAGIRVYGSTQTNPGGVYVGGDANYPGSNAWFSISVPPFLAEA